MFKNFFVVLGKNSLVSNGRQVMKVHSVGNVIPDLYYAVLAKSNGKKGSVLVWLSDDETLEGRADYTLQYFLECCFANEACVEPVLDAIREGDSSPVLGKFLTINVRNAHKGEAIVWDLYPEILGRYTKPGSIKNFLKANHLEESSIDNAILTRPYRKALKKLFEQLKKEGRAK